MSLIPDVELITVDKGAGLSAYSRLRTDMKRRGAFDLLLHLQLSMRASAAAALIPAPVKLGFDKPRARELQWLFTNARIAARAARARARQLHGIRRCARRPRSEGPRWDIPLPSAALAYAEHLIPDAQPTLVISACSSHRAAQLAARALCGGGRLRRRPARHARDPVRRPERRRARDGRGHRQARARAAGRTRWPRTPCRSCWRCCRARRRCSRRTRAPRTWPPWWTRRSSASMRATNPERSGPYLSRRWCVDAYDAAARKFLRQARERAALDHEDRGARASWSSSRSPAVTAKLDELLALQPQSERLS